MRMRALLISGVFSLVAFCAGAAHAMTMTLDESRALAQQALLQKRPDVTLQIAQALVSVNPNDAHALLMIAAAQAELDQPTPARKAAALAYRRAENPKQRLQAARIAAEQALVEEKPSLTQIWLRRAALHTTTDEQTDALARAYSRVRSINPWSLHLGLSIRPSDNVNNGSNSAFNVIEGISSVGVIDPASQALSGTIGTFDATLGYRLRGDARSRTTLRTRLQQREVQLSNEAKRLAPNASGNDFGWTYADVEIEHAFAVGERKGDHAKFALTQGALWTNDGKEYDFTRLSAERVWMPNSLNRFRLSGQASQFLREDSANDSTTFSMTGGYDHKRANGDTAGLALTLRKAESDNANSRAEAASLKLSYSFGKKWGPAEASASLTYTHSDYDDFTVLNQTPGREDQSLNANLSLFFSDYDYAGFAPKVTLRASRRSSNISLFETREVSVIFGVQSKF